MMTIVRRVLAHLLFRQIRKGTKPGRAGLHPLPWSGPAGEVMLGVIDLDGSLVEVVGTRSPRQLSRLIAEHSPGAPLPDSLRRYLRHTA